MTHKAKGDWWVAAALIVGVIAPFAGARLWITVPLFLAVGICGYPQCYVTTDKGLEIRSGLVRWSIPYESITFVEPLDDEAGFPISGRVSVRYGPGARALIAPADTRRFITDMAGRARHLTRRGQRLAPRYV